MSRAVDSAAGRKIVCSICRREIVQTGTELNPLWGWKHVDDSTDQCKGGERDWAGVASGEQPSARVGSVGGKVSYIGAPKVFALEIACQQVRAAFGEYGVFLVGSSLDRADWRDVDVRYVLTDEGFRELFPNAGEHWEHDPRWLLLTVSISEWMSRVTGLPVDFQFQPQTHANKKHPGKRYAVGFALHNAAADRGEEKLTPEAE